MIYDMPTPFGTGLSAHQLSDFLRCVAGVGLAQELSQCLANAIGVIRNRMTGRIRVAGLQ